MMRVRFARRSDLEFGLRQHFGRPGSSHACNPAMPETKSPGDAADLARISIGIAHGTRRQPHALPWKYQQQQSREKLWLSKALAGEKGAHQAKACFTMSGRCSG